MSETIALPLFKKAFTVRTVIVLLVLVAVGSVLRSYDLTAYSLWLDELFSMRGSDPASSLHEIVEYSKGDQPPAFFMLLHGWLKLFGYTDVAGRGLSVVIGVLGIPTMYFLGKEFKSPAVGLMASFITAINWFHADISREIRFYPLVFLLSAVSYLFFFRSLTKGRLRDFFWYVLFTGLLLNTHYYALVVFASQFIMFLFAIPYYGLNRKLVLRAVLAGFIAGLSIVHWLPVILNDLQINEFHVTPVPFYFPLTFGWVYFKDPVAGVIYALCAFLMLRHLVKGDTGHRLPMEDFVVLGWILIGFMIPLLYSWIKIPLLTPKYSTITLPGIFLLIASGFLLIKKQTWRMYAVLGLIIGAAIAIFVSRPLYRPPVTDDWREVAQFFAESPHGKQTIFAQLAYFHKYYFQKMGYNQEMPIDQRWADFDHIVAGSERIWLLRHPRYPDNGFSPEQQQTVDSAFDLTKVVEFQETQAFLYERRR